VSEQDATRYGAVFLEDVVPGPSVVTIGNFDGVHRGHRVLLGRAVDAARRHEVRSVAITFDPHPAAVLRPGSEPTNLQTLDDRVDALYATGVDLVLVLEFTAELASLSPQEFIERVLVDRLRAVKVIVGTNFRFGHKAAGDVVTLNEAGAVHGFEIEAVTLLDLDGRPISSSEIRDRLAAGDVEWSARALGRPHRVVGTVVAGDGRGRTIGVPTANVRPDDGLQVPAHGVYAGHAWLGERSWPCVTNVGTRPTFDGRDVSVEAHLLDAEVDLYDRRLAVTFEHRLRGEQRFDGPDDLVAQIHRDIARAHEHLDA
jgi:riboflavin kinase / FMN adenylyltransferase